MLLGYARGKVGSMVFQRAKGEQITKAYNGNPQNPRSNRQVHQRASFANNVKFFTRGIQNLFKFAYEDKKDNESDFNAFMRHNSKRGVLISRFASQMANYPAIGRYMLSRGTLTSPQFEVVESETLFVPVQKLKVPGLTADDKWGLISQKLMTAYNLRKGDIVTFLHITAFGSTINNTPQIEPEERNQVEWKVTQGVIDPTSEQTLTFATYDGHIYAAEDGIEIEAGNPNILGACSVIFSRQTRRKLRCSTSFLMNNEAAEVSLGLADTYDYKTAVYESWRGVPESILQGGVAPENPSFHGYMFEFYLDQACTMPAVPGSRTNKLYCKVNGDPDITHGSKTYGNYNSHWQNMTLQIQKDDDGVNNYFLKVWYADFLSSPKTVPPRAGDVITLAQQSSQTITIGDGAIYFFEKLDPNV